MSGTIRPFGFYRCFAAISFCYLEVRLSVGRCADPYIINFVIRLEQFRNTLVPAAFRIAGWSFLFGKLAAKLWQTYRITTLQGQKASGGASQVEVRKVSRLSQQQKRVLLLNGYERRCY